MQIQIQTQINQPLVLNQSLREVIEYIKKYVSKDVTLKELCDLALAIDYLIAWALENEYSADDRLSEIEMAGD